MRKDRTGLLLLGFVLALHGCGGVQNALPTLPAAHATNVKPADSIEPMPGDSIEPMPGDSIEPMPGSDLACKLTLQADAANCSVAINTTIPPLADAGAPANLLRGLHPADLQAAYGLPAANAGGTVAIVDAYDDPLAEADLAVYRSAFGLPACTSSNGCFRKINQNGGSASYPAPDAGWSTEIALDLDMVSAACPKCKILLVEAQSNSYEDLGAAVDTAASLGTLAVSNSYYGPEWPGETTVDAHYDHPGIALTVSAGDEPGTFYPAASPYVTSVGGTSLAGGTETAWQYGARGCSRYEVKPAWQHVAKCGSRSVVDVAAIADPQTGVTMFDSAAGGWLVAGGTSVGAPIIAAAYALSGNPQGPAFSYARASAFHNLGSGGYDAATGLGTLSGVGGL